jgi:hypothetical protein
VKFNSAAARVEDRLDTIVISGKALSRVLRAYEKEARPSKNNAALPAETAKAEKFVTPRLV